MVETLEQEKIKGTRVGYGFSISDCPLWLYKSFVQGVKTEYNDIYWVKLMDLMRKAEAYDMLMSGVLPGAEALEKPEVKEQKYIETMGDRIPLK